MIILVKMDINKIYRLIYLLIIFLIKNDDLIYNQNRDYFFELNYY